MEATHKEGEMSGVMEMETELVKAKRYATELEELVAEVETWYGAPMKRSLSNSGRGSEVLIRVKEIANTVRLRRAREEARP